MVVVKQQFYLYYTEHYARQKYTFYIIETL